MGVLARLVSIGPLLGAFVFIAMVALFAFAPTIFTYTPYIAIVAPALALSMLAWRRAYPSIIARARWDPYDFWYASCPELRFYLPELARRRLDPSMPLRPNEMTLVLDDLERKDGWAVKCLRVADVERSFETTTEDERLLLIDGFAKAIEGLSDVEAKLVIERGEHGEVAHILLYSHIEDGDEEGAFDAVENAAKVLADSLEPLGIILIDDASYIGFESTGFTEKPYRPSPKPSKNHAITLLACSIATAASSLLTPYLGNLSTSLLIAGIAGAIPSVRALLLSSTFNDPKPRKRWRLEGDAVYYRLMPRGILVAGKKGEKLYEEASMYLSFSANMNRELSYEDMEKRLPKYLEIFSSMIYGLKNIRVAIHVKPEDPGDAVRIALAKADYHSMDASVGGSISGWFKASKKMNLADRILRGERPYTLSGVVEVRVKAPKITGREIDLLEKEIRSAASFMDSINIQTRRVSDGYGAMLCRRFIYLPKLGYGLFDPDPIAGIKALTRDFIAMTPIAFRRRPMMPRDGLYWGRDTFDRRVYWNPETLPNPHILVLGTPGSGKSTFIKTMIFRLSQLKLYTGTGKPPSMIIVDPAGEYADKADLLKELGLEVEVIDLIKRKYNPLLLAGLDPENRASRLVDVIFANIMELTPWQSSILYQGILNAYRAVGGLSPSSPESWNDGNASKVTIMHVYDYICWRLKKAVENVEKAGGVPDLDPAVSMLMDLERRLRPLAKGPLALDRTDITVESLLERRGIMILSFRTNVAEGQITMAEDAQRLIVWSLLDHIYSRMVADKVTEGLRLMVVIDEGHKFLIGRVGEVPIAQHMRETRKFGVGYVIVTHMLDDLKQERDIAVRRGLPSITSLVGTTVVFNPGGAEEVKTASELLGLTEKERRRLQAFHTGEAFVKWSTDPRPLEFKVEPDQRALIRERLSRRAMLYEMQ